MEAELALPVPRNRARARAEITGGLWLWVSLVATLSALGAAPLLAPAGNAQPMKGLTWLLFVGSSVHVAATGYLFTEGDVRTHMAEHRPRYIWAPAALVAFTAALASALPVPDLVWVLVPYFAWQFFHFHKQNLGIVALAALSSARTSPSRAERRALSLAASFGILGLLAHPGLLQLSGVTVLSHFFVVAQVGFIGAAGWAVVLLLARPRNDLGLSLVATYFMALSFFAPIFLFQSPYAAVGGMTIGHGLQYLLLVGMIAAGRDCRKLRAIGVVLLFDIALLGGILLNAASHFHNGSAALRALFGVYLGVAMAHFVIDAGIWRLHEAFPRRFIASRLPFLVVRVPLTVLPSVNPLRSQGDRS